MHRRNLLKGALFGSVALLLPASHALADAAIGARLAALERRHGGRLGVGLLDTGSGRRYAHRGDERFLMCSTFKVLAVATLLARVDRGQERLDRRVVFGKEALLDYAPTTSSRVGAPGMRLEALCEAAVVLSDNTAANLLLSALGGPRAVTAFVRGLGDRVTRLDRTEPQLNLAAPGDVRDTTTPLAMLQTLQRVLLGDALAAPSRERLLGWMRGCRTGTDKLRAGLPAGWRAGDKTGSGPQGESNDIAIAWPPGRAPLLATAYYVNPALDGPGRSAVLAEVGRLLGSA